MAYCEIVDDRPLRCGEGPLWDWRNGLFYWIDITGAKLFCLDPKTGKSREVCSGKNISGYTINENGGFVCATHQGIFLWDETRGWTLIADQFQGRKLQCNDAAADPAGRFLFGTTYYNDVPGATFPRGRLYSMNAGREFTVLDDGFGLINGIGFSPDGGILYVVDTFCRTVWAYDYDAQTGAVSAKRAVVRVPDNEGIPDGMTVDAAGDLWVVQWYGYGVYQYSPDGRLKLHIPVPSGQTSSVAFGGEELTDLYVTSAGEVDHHLIAPRGYDFDAPHNGFTYRIRREGLKGKREYFARIDL